MSDQMKTSWESRLFLRSASLTAFAFALCLAQTGLAQSSRSPVLTAREIAKRASESVVMIVSEDSTDRSSALGSGFFVKDDLIATNFHVIKDAKRIRVKLVGRRDFYFVQEVAHQDKVNDLALLRVSGVPAKSLPLSNDAQVGVGDDVFVLSNPEGLEGTFSQGIVSALRESSRGGKKLIQITAPISKGSSGAPVMNSRGEVIGVAVGLLENGQNLNFVVPEAYLRELFSSLARPPLTVYGDPKSFPKEKSPESSTDSWLNRGKTYIFNGRYLEAIEALKQAIKQNPDDWRCYLSLGIAYDFLERRQEAIIAYKQALEIKPDEWRTYLNLGLTYNSLERYEEARSACKQALRLNPDNPDLHVSLGRVYRNLEKYREAVTAFKGAIKLDPDNTEAFYNLGMAYHYLEQWQEALAAYKQAIRLKPDFADAHQLLGFAYLAVGDVGGALDQYKILKRLDPNLAEGLFKLIYK